MQSLMTTCRVNTTADPNMRNCLTPKKSENVRAHSSNSNGNVNSLHIVTPVTKMRPYPTAHPHKPLTRKYTPRATTAAWLAQLGERRSAEQEVAGSNPGRTNTQGL